MKKFGELLKNTFLDAVERAWGLKALKRKRAREKMEKELFEQFKGERELFEQWKEERARKERKAGAE